MIPYSKQLIEEDDIRAVIQALQGDLITTGPYVDSFEKEIASFCHAREGIAFSNGTAALHAACLALGIKEGDEGIISPISFAASSNCIEYVGGKSKFVDVTSGIPCIDPNSVRKHISSQTKVLIPVDFAGSVANLPELWEIAKEKNIPIIEDACHALGALYQDPTTQEWHHVGSCKHSTLTVFSFHPVKNITSGEGGMITTNDTHLAKELRRIRHHGITTGIDESRPWYYEINELGYNFRLTDFQAALGLSQLKKLTDFITRKRSLFERYQEKLAALTDITILKPAPTSLSALHLMLIQINDPQLRDPLFRYLRQEGIGCQVHYLPIYRHPYYSKKYRANPNNFPHAENYYHRTLTLPLYPSLTLEDQDTIIQKLFQGFDELRKKGISNHDYENSCHY